MKYTILINQAGIAAANLTDKTNFDDWAVLDYIAGWQANHRATLRDGHVWINFKHLLSEMPLLRTATKQGVSDIIKKLKDLGLVTAIYDFEKRVYLKPTPLYHDAVSFQACPKIEGGVKPDGQGVKQALQGGVKQAGHSLDYQFSIDNQDSSFDEFWNEYRLKVARPAAEKAFAKAIKRADLQTILAGVRQYNAFLVRNPTRAKAHPATWLNNERWNDQMEAGNEENRQHTQRYKPTKTDRLNAVLREALSPDFTGYGWPGRADADPGAVLSRPESVWEGTRTDEIHDSPSSNGAGPIPDRSGPRGLW